MGTFEIVNNFTSVSNASPRGAYPLAGFFNLDSELTTDAELLKGVNAVSFDTLVLGGTPNTSGVPAVMNCSGTCRFTFDQGSAIISLDGAPPISFNSLPSGFTLVSAQLNALQSLFIQTVLGSPPQQLQGTINIDNLKNDEDFSVGPTNTGFLDIAPQLPFVYDVASFPQMTMLQLLLNGITFTFTGSGQVFDLGPTDPGQIQFFISEFSITGEYTTFVYQYEIEGPPDPVEPGDPISITSTGPDALDMEQITDVDIEYIDENGDLQTIEVPEDLWITIESNLFIFLMPDFPIDCLWFDVVITSTQFSGSVTLGTFITLYFTSATGIYKLDTDLFHDTLYLESDPPNTVDVKIPNPTFKTGYIGG